MRRPNSSINIHIDLTNNFYESRCCETIINHQTLRVQQNLHIENRKFIRIYPKRRVSVGEDTRGLTMEDLLGRRGLFWPLFFSGSRHNTPRSVPFCRRGPFAASFWSLFDLHVPRSEVGFSREPPTLLFFPYHRQQTLASGYVCVCTCRPRKHAILLRLYSLSGSVMENHPRGISRYCAARAWSPFPRSGVSICRRGSGFCSGSWNFCVYVIFFELGLYAKLYKLGVNKMGSFLRKVLAESDFFVLTDFNK